MGKGKRGKKDHYKQMKMQQSRTEDIKDGLKGFFVTCKTGTEKRAIKELFNVLNEYTDKLYPNIEELRKINDEKLALERIELEKLRPQKPKVEQTENKPEIQETKVSFIYFMIFLGKRRGKS